MIKRRMEIVGSENKQWYIYTLNINQWSMWVCFYLFLYSSFLLNLFNEFVVKRHISMCHKSLLRAKNLLLPRLSFRVVIVLSRQRRYWYNHYHNSIRIFKHEDFSITYFNTKCISSKCSLRQPKLGNVNVL